HGGLDAQADLWGQGSSQHVRDEQASLEPPEISVSRLLATKGSASAGPFSFLDKPRLGGARSAPPEAVEPLLCHRKAQMRRDGDKFLAVALLHPRGYRLDWVAEGVGTDRVKTGMLRQSLQGSSRRKDQPRGAIALA